MRLDIAAQTDVGRRKKKNEDSFGVFREDYPGLNFFDEGALLIVADGLGGHVGGEIASKLGVSIVRDILKEEPPAPITDGDETQGPLPILRRYMLKANDNIFQTNRDLVTNGRPMGTTLLAVLVSPKKAYIGNVGDTRAYHIRDNEILERTEDHSWVDEQVKQGLMSKAEAESDSRKNMVTRSVGTNEEIDVDTYIWHIVPGDMILLATDGLINMVKESEIVAEFRKGGTPAEIAYRLVQMANENGGKDNITVCIASISPSLLRFCYQRIRSWWRRAAYPMLWVAFWLLTLIVGIVLGSFLAKRGIL
jgi:serine/threonine protein phosphatase PrpC